ncbi:hypothetical protein Tco_0360624 [Tanacetum coccineum]
MITQSTTVVSGGEGGGQGWEGGGEGGEVVVNGRIIFESGRENGAFIAASEAAMYSASVADIAVVLCLELFQSTAPPFKMKKYHV